MNMQKMGKLCKENMSMKLYRKGCTQYMGQHCQDGIRRGAVCRLPDAAESNEDQRFPL